MQVGGTESARAALDLGADYLVLPGTGSRGPCATHEWAVRGTAESVERGPKRSLLSLPGGIGDGHGIRKALLSGAWRAMLGTRFVATIESNAHPSYKKAVVAARARDTALTICFQDGWSAMHRHRVECGICERSSRSRRTCSSVVARMRDSIGGVSGNYAARPNLPGIVSANSVHNGYRKTSQTWGCRKPQVAFATHIRRWRWFANCHCTRWPVASERCWQYSD